MPRGHVYASRRRFPRPDFPIEDAGTSTYLLVGIPGGLRAAFTKRSQADGRSWRNAILTLMQAYADGAIALPAEEEPAWRPRAATRGP